MNTGRYGIHGRMSRPARSGRFYTSDPAQGTYLDVLFNPNQTTDSGTGNKLNSLYLPNANGCQFDGALTGNVWHRFQLASGPGCLRKSSRPD
jgi:hypothetical protein